MFHLCNVTSLFTATFMYDTRRQLRHAAVMTVRQQSQKGPSESHTADMFA